MSRVLSGGARVRRLLERNSWFFSYFKSLAESAYIILIVHFRVSEISHVLAILSNSYVLFPVCLLRGLDFLSAFLLF